MFPQETIIESAFQLVRGIIMQGGHLLADKGMVIGYKDKEGLVKTFSLYKKKDPKSDRMDLVYEGIKSEKAAMMYVALVGPLHAFGHAIGWYRNSRSERNKQVITVK